MPKNDADGMANSADPDQTAPLGQGWQNIDCPGFPIMVNPGISQDGKYPQNLENWEI